MKHLTVIDSNGRIPPGVLSGATSDFGSVQQCISIVSSPFSFESLEPTVVDKEKEKDNTDDVITSEASTIDSTTVSPASVSLSESVTVKSPLQSLNQLDPVLSTRMSKFQGKYCLLSLKPSLPHRSTPYHSYNSHHADHTEDNDPHAQGSSSANTHTLNNSSTVAPSRFNKSSSEGNVCFFISLSLSIL